MLKDIIEHMKCLTEMHGAPGHEYLIRDYLKAHMAPLADEVIQDNLGGIFFVKKSNNPNAKKVLIAAHMDEVGFMVTQILENGLLKFIDIGGWSTDVLLSQHMKVLTKNKDELSGIISSVPKHFQTGDSKLPKITEMLLDVGATSKEEVVSMGIRIGDPIVPNVSFKQLTKDRYLCKAWDNRYGCTIIIDILQSLKDVSLPFDLYIGANVQEEVGLRGAKVSSHMIKPDIAFVVDCSPANDLIGDKSGELGKGTLLRFYDRAMLLQPAFKDYMLELFDQHEVKYQYYVSPGATDAAEIQVANDGIPSAVIGVPARYIHSSHSIFDIKDYIAAKSGLMHLLKDLTPEKIQYLKKN